MGNNINVYISHFRCWGYALHTHKAPDPGFEMYNGIINLACISNARTECHYTYIGRKVHTLT